MTKFTFHKVQRGYWGSSDLGKSLTITAKDRDEAWSIVMARKDFMKRLKNGDTVTWSYDA